MEQRGPQISALKLAQLIISDRLFASTTYLPSVTGGETANKDAWITMLIAGIGDVIFTWLVVKLASRHSNQSLLEMCTSLLGKWPGKIIFPIFLVFSFDMCVISVRGFAEVLNSAVIPETPKDVLIISVCLAAAYCVYRGLEGIMGCNSLLFPISIGLIILALALVAKDVHLETLLPILEDGWPVPLTTLTIPLSWTSETVLILMLIRFVRDKENVLPFAISAQVFVSLLTSALIVCTIGVFGFAEARNLTLPTYSLIRMISVAQFVERIDFVLVIVWTNIILIKVAIYLYVFVTGTGQLLGLRSTRFLIAPFAGLIIMFASGSFERIQDYLRSISSETFGLYSAIIVILTVILLIASLLRKRKATLA